MKGSTSRRPKGSRGATLFGNAVWTREARRSLWWVSAQFLEWEALQPQYFCKHCISIVTLVVCPGLLFVLYIFTVYIKILIWRCYLWLWPPDLSQWMIRRGQTSNRLACDWETSKDPQSVCFAARNLFSNNKAEPYFLGASSHKKLEKRGLPWQLPIHALQSLNYACAQLHIMCSTRMTNGLSRLQPEWTSNKGIKTHLAHSESSVASFALANSGYSCRTKVIFSNTFVFLARSANRSCFVFQTFLVACWSSFAEYRLAWSASQQSRIIAHTIRQTETRNRAVIFFLKNAEHGVKESDVILD